MVFFVCGACGGSFKRKQADQHTMRCSSWNFSCMDCQTDFEGHSYVKHTKCITESEKYFGDHHKEKVGKDKNEIFMKKLKQHFESQEKLPAFISRFIKRMLMFPSVPRKVVPFKNFLKQNMNLHDPKTVDTLLAFIEAANNVTLVGDSQNSSNKENKAAPVKAIENEVKDKTVENEDNAETEKVEKKKSKKNKRASKESDDEEDEAVQQTIKESKSARRKKRKIELSSTDEPIMNGTNENKEEKDMADLEDIKVDTVQIAKNFKWRRTLKNLLAEGPEEGTKLKKLLNQIEQLHNHPLYGAAEPLPKETLEKIMMKMLGNKPFSIKENRAKKGQFADDDEE